MQTSELDITFDEVKQYVKKLPSTAIAGHCARAGSCLIAEAVWAKLPGLVREADSVHVLPDVEYSEVSILAFRGDTRNSYVQAIRGPEGRKLARLAYAFDNAGAWGTPVPQPVALGIVNAVEGLMEAGCL